MTATQVLEHEHDVILLVLDAAEREAGAISQAGRADEACVGKFIDFSRNFADRCHHGKGEEHLFPRLEERGVRREGGPIGVLLAEHEQGRSPVRKIAESLPGAAGGRPDAASSLVEAMLDYVRLLRKHIRKENGGLLLTANRVLTEDDQRQLSEAFERVEAEEMGPGFHEKYHRLAHEFAES